MKQLLCYLTLSFSCLLLFANEKAENDSTYLKDSLAEEQFKRYIDSIGNALYPRLEICTNTNPNRGTFNKVKSLATTNDFPTSVAVDKTKEVGDIPYTSNTSPTGGKLYEIPIQLPKGINGFQPELVISYNSQGGNSELGWGWSISGLSKVERVPRNYYFDSKADGIKMNNTDAFALDGLRLIGNSTLTNNTILQTERDNILVKPNISDNLYGFDVYYPDGTKANYGFEDPERDYLAYPIASKTDQFGNTIEFFYGNVWLAPTISSVHYNGYTVEFSYSNNRPDKILTFSGGSKNESSMLLNKITVKNGSSILYTYNLEHIIKNGKSLLSKITFASGDKEYNPLQFFYGNGDIASAYTTSEYQAIRYYRSKKRGDLKVSMGKFDYENNADGIIVAPNYYSYYQVETDAGTFKHSKKYFYNYYDADESIFLYGGLEDDIDSALPEIKTGEGFIDILCADLNGDKQENIIKINNIANKSTKKETVTFTVYGPRPYMGVGKLYDCSFTFSTTYTDAADNVTLQPKFYYTGDFDGDGRTEILAVSMHRPFGDISLPSKCYLFDLENRAKIYEGSPLTYNIELEGSKQPNGQAAENHSDKIFTFDANGDGKTDICHITESGTTFYTFVKISEKLTLQKLNTTSSLSKGLLVNTDIALGDYNGDGLIDILTNSRNTLNQTWKIYYSTGKGEFSDQTISGPSFKKSDSSGICSQDINGDGFSDLIVYNNANSETYLGLNNVISSDAIQKTLPKSTSVLIPININSKNAFTNLVCLTDSVITRLTFSRDDNAESMISAMVSSHGKIEKNSYRRMIAIEGDGFYTMGDDAELPFINLQEPLLALSQSDTYIDGSKIDGKSYTYKNALYHVGGLGFCGIEEMTETNMKGQTSTQTYAPTRYPGLLVSEITPAKESNYEYDINQSSTKLTKILLSKKTDKDILKNFTITSTYTYDNYGYPTTETVSHSDNSIGSGKHFTYLHQPLNNGKYQLGLLKEVEETKQRDGEEMSYRTTVDAFVKNLPSKISYYKGNNRLKLVNRTFDSKGCVLSEKITPCQATVSRDEFKTYDTQGNVLTETDKLGRTNSHSYDKYGNRISTNDYRGGLSTYDYDVFGQMIKEIKPDSSIIQTTYSWSGQNSRGLYCKTITETGKPSRKIYYEALGREILEMTQNFDGSFALVDKSYDDYGNLKKETLPFQIGEPIVYKNYTYDEYDRITSCTSSGKSTTYSYNDNSITTNHNGTTIKRVYDSLGNIISSTDACGSTNFIYWPNGQIQSASSANLITFIEYDEYDRKSYMSDSCAGITKYEYDKAGNLSKQTNANGDIIEFTFDDYDQLLEVYGDDYEIIYSYDPETGDLYSVSSDLSDFKQFEYDVMGRLVKSKESVSNIWLQKDVSYTNGNISQIVYKTKNGILATEKYTYSYGHLKKVVLNNSTIFDLVSAYSSGLPLQVKTGELVRYYTYDSSLRPQSRTVSRGENIYQKLYYDYATGTDNLSKRSDLNRNLIEQFSYDNLNRLVAYGDETISYDAKGNVTAKSDVGTMVYSLRSRPCALSSIETANNAISSNSQNITYTAFNRPSTLEENGILTCFGYDSNYDRASMRITKNDSTLLEKYYIGGCYEYDATNKVEYLYAMGDYYKAPAVCVNKLPGFVVGPVFPQKKKAQAASGVYYILRDNLGSITHVIDKSYTVVEENSYDAWGRMRNPATQVVYDYAHQPELFLGRGYCGHEHLPYYGLINMNARLYDPVISRFISPDPYIQAPDYSQNMNRFSYAMNNPFLYKDPNGEFFIFTIFNAIGEALNGFRKHGFNVSQYNWKKTVNSWKINMGMFKGNFLQVLNKWTWNIGNSLRGTYLGEFYNALGKVDGVTHMDGMLALSGATDHNKAATIGHISLGPKGYKATWKDHLFVHEYGHYCQSQVYGIAFIPVIAIPSVISAGLFPNSHYKHWFERDANRRTVKHFNRHYGKGAEGDAFDEKYFRFGNKRNGIESPYENPRKKGYNNNPNPASTADVNYIENYPI